MTERSRWIVGNWKQNGLRDAARALAEGIAEGIAERASALADADVHVGVAPPLLALDTVNAALRTHEEKVDGRLWLVAQDVAAQESGAHTGEVGPAMLAEAGVAVGIVGHSERRALYGDTDALVAAKLGAAIAAGMQAIVCVGEPLPVREDGEHEKHVISQLSTAFKEVSPEVMGRVSVAYEPVWAIGTGKTASPDQAAAMHAAIRNWLATRYNRATAAGSSLLYGGSVKPNNAADLMAAGDVDGFLVGGASLDPASFLDIVQHVARAPRA